MIVISNKQRASLVGIFILVAYSMLTYSVTKNIAWGFITDILSGLAVIGIPILMFPIFNINELDFSRIVENRPHSPVVIPGNELINDKRNHEPEKYQ